MSNSVLQYNTDVGYIYTFKINIYYYHTGFYISKSNFLLDGWTVGRTL